MLHGYIVIFDPKICRMFRGGGKPQLCQAFAQNADISPQNFKPETLFEARQVGETGFLAPLPASEAPGHLSSLHPPRRLWTAGTLQPRRGRCMPPGGAALNLRRFPRGRRPLGEEADFAETTKVVGSCVPRVQPTVSDSTSSKLFKATYIHKQNEQVSIHLSCK